MRPWRIAVGLPADGAFGHDPVQHRVLFRAADVLVPRNPGLRHSLDGDRKPSSAGRCSRSISCRPGPYAIARYLPFYYQMYFPRGDFSPAA